MMMHAVAAFHETIFFDFSVATKENNPIYTTDDRLNVSDTCICTYMKFG